MEERFEMMQTFSVVKLCVGNDVVVFHSPESSFTELLASSTADEPC